MLSIGDFAKHAGLSVRMLRHYDQLGLLTPHAVDPVTGYRSYSATQFPRVNRLVALKDLGFALDQVGRILDGGVGAEELRGMLRLREAQLAEQITADQQRLTGVAARLRAIEREGTMSEHEFLIKPLPAGSLAQVRDRVESMEEIGPMVGSLFERLGELMGAAGLRPAGPATASYTPLEAGGVDISVGWPTSAGSATAASGGLELVDLPAVEQALTLVHHGPMDDIGAAWQALETEVERRGLATSGPGRELYLETPFQDPTGWVTELQQPVA
ncbi:MerR family transcriptional regulator [Nocardioides nanhaiensis]|uniref:MerR family transcriptional regulator n=1 Tax=Nocardioides nanhaiensis TaxID=1476871 RepID=A0ABP8VYA8_9ACTN